MTIGEIKQFLAQVPDTFNDFGLAVREASFLDEAMLEKAKAEGKNPDEVLYAAMDKPVVACFVDENTKELALLDAPSYNVIASVMQAQQAPAEEPSAEVLEEGEPDSNETDGETEEAIAAKEGKAE